MMQPAANSFRDASPRTHFEYLLTGLAAAATQAKATYFTQRQRGHVDSVQSFVSAVAVLCDLRDSDSLSLSDLELRAVDALALIDAYQSYANAVTSKFSGFLTLALNRILIDPDSPKTLNIWTLIGDMKALDANFRAHCEHLAMVVNAIRRPTQARELLKRRYLNTPTFSARSELQKAIATRVCVRMKHVANAHLQPYSQSAPADALGVLGAESFELDEATQNGFGDAYAAPVTEWVEDDPDGFGEVAADQVDLATPPKSSHALARLGLFMKSTAQGAAQRLTKGANQVAAFARKTVFPYPNLPLIEAITHSADLLPKSCHLGSEARAEMVDTLRGQLQVAGDYEQSAVEALAGLDVGRSNG